MNARNIARLSELSKSGLVAIAKGFNLALGDYARKSKDEIIGLILANVNEQQIDDALDAGVAAVPAEVQAKPKAPQAQQSGDAAAKLAEAIQAIAGNSVNEERVREIVAEVALPVIESAIAGLPPRRYEISINGETVRTVEGHFHKQFDTLLRACKRRLNVWLAGPAGSGKTTAAEKVAEVLGIPFYFTGAIDTEYKLLGFTDAQGKIVSTQFRQAYESGGVFLFDEVDGSLAAALLAFNAALANGVCAFPDGMVRRHKDFVCIAAANTWGHGATMEYVGRAKLDGASLDRFVKVAWDYDEALETALSGNSKWTKYVQDVRAKARAKGLKHVISPRASIFGAELLAEGFTHEEVCNMTMAAGLAPDQWQAIK